MTLAPRSGFDAPVLVIGNGPVGQTAALLLAHWGVPSIIVDQRPSRDPAGSKAIAQQHDILDIWDTVGAGRQIADEGVTWRRSRTFYRDQELFCLEYQDDVGGAFPPFVNLGQTRTEQILEARVRDQPLIDQRWRHRVTGIDQDADGVRVTCETPDGSVEVRAEYAVACVGSRGGDIRSALSVSFDGRTFGDQFLICDIQANLPDWEDERRFHFDPEWNPGRQVLIHPCPDSTYRIDWQVPEDFDLAAEAANGRLDDRVRAIIGDRPYRMVWSSVYRFHSRIADRFRVGRVLLAGDAAHLVSPFGGRGLNSGVQDAENAAWKLAAVLEGLADEALLESYHGERHAAAVENLAITDATMKFLVPQMPEEHEYRRDVLERSLRDPAARAEVDSGRLAEPFWYAHSSLTTPDPARPFSGRPPKGSAPPPGPGVLVSDVPAVDPATGEPTRLRLLMRTGLHVLAGDDVDVVALKQGLDGIRALAGVYRASDLADGAAEKLAIRSDEVWVIRPDGYLAATFAAPELDEIARAIHRIYR